MVTLESSGREMAREMGRGRTEESEMQNADHNPHAQHVHHLKYKMFQYFFFCPCFLKSPHESFPYTYQSCSVLEVFENIWTNRQEYNWSWRENNMNTQLNPKYWV